MPSKRQHTDVIMLVMITGGMKEHKCRSPKEKKMFKYALTFKNINTP